MRGVAIEIGLEHDGHEEVMHDSIVDVRSFRQYHCTAGHSLEVSGPSLQMPQAVRVRGSGTARTYHFDCYLTCWVAVCSIQMSDVPRRGGFE